MPRQLRGADATTSDRRKEMEQERLHKAGNAGAGPEVGTEYYWSVTSEGERWEHNPVKGRSWPTVPSCFIKIPWCQVSALSGPLLEK